MENQTESELVIVCCVCPSVRVKERQTLVDGNVGEWIKVTRQYIDHLKRQDKLGNLTLSHSYCPPCGEKAFEEVEESYKSHPPMKNNQKAYKL